MQGRETNVDAILSEKIPPSLLTRTTRMIRGSDFEFITEIEDRYKKWLDALQSERTRLFDNLRAFYAINGGAWPDEALSVLEEQGRHATSINIAEQKIRNLAGSIQAEKWDFNFTPMNHQRTTLTENIKHWYYADAEQYNYHDIDNRILLRGLIHVGIAEMEERYDIRRTGAIAFTPTIPGSVLKDPYWQSGQLCDWRRAMKMVYMTADEMREHFEVDWPELTYQSALDSKGRESYEPIENVDAFRDSEEMHGSRYAVIEYRWLEHMKADRMYGLMPDGQWVPFPLRMTSQEEIMAYKDMLGIESAENLRVFPYEDNVLQVATVCPQISRYKFLAKGKSAIQCGTIGFFPFSSASEMGIDKGVMESLIDLQRTLNYRESKKDEIISSGGSGATVVNVDALDNGKRSVDEIKQNKTRPDYVLGVHGDPRNVIASFPRTEVPDAILTDIASIVDLFDRVTPVTPALEGTGTSQESGVLFEMRHQVSKLGTLILHDNWHSYMLAKAEAWYNQAPLTYRGIYTKVKKVDAPGYAEFNVPLADDAGMGVYLNDITELPRARVIVTLSKHSPTEQLAKRAMFSDILKTFSANPELFKFQIRMAANKMLETLELGPEEREELRKMAEIQGQIDKVESFSQLQALIANAMNSKVMQAQAAQVLAQMQNMGGGQQQMAGPEPAVSRALPTPAAPPDAPTGPGQEPELAMVPSGAGQQGPIAP